ncbi:hypothetical protein ABPG77_007241 [Micractinium sp. CCAP 211/92]
MARLAHRRLLDAPVIRGSIRHNGTNRCFGPPGADAQDNTFVNLYSASCLVDTYVLLPSGSIQHEQTGRCLHPLGGATSPNPMTPLVFYASCDLPRLAFNYLPNGALQHVISGLCLQSAYGFTFEGGFNGKSFDVKAQAGTQLLLLGSTRQGFSLQSKVELGGRPGTTVMQAFQFTSGTSNINVELQPPLLNRPFWRLTAEANGQPVAQRASTPAGVSVLLVPARQGQPGRVEIAAGFIRVVVTQPWQPQQGADFLNLDIQVLKPLQLPVSGVLGRSYAAT